MKLAEKIVFPRDGEESLCFWLLVPSCSSSSYNGKYKVSEPSGIQHFRAIRGKFASNCLSKVLSLESKNLGQSHECRIMIFYIV